MRKKIFIFGSKPNTQIPNEKCDLILSANGGAYYANKYLKKIKDNKISHTNISTDQGFIKIPKLREYVECSMPDKVIFRGDRIQIGNHSKKISSSNVKIEYQSYLSQFLFQRKFFKRGLLDLIRAEMKYEKNNKIKQLYYFLKILRSGVILGCSTGIYTVLYALNKFPNHTIYLYGISLSGGKQFYNNKKISDKNFKRYNVDKNLFVNLKQEFKDRIIFC
jgi:hypothetical protein